MNRRKAASAVLLSAAMLLGGCQTIALVVQWFVPYVVSAEYEPADQATVIFVDDPKRLLPSEQFAIGIAEQIGNHLVRESVVSEPHLLNPAEVFALRAKHADFGRWSIGRIGRAVEAKQVLYVLIENFHLGEGNNTFKPAASVQIKLYNAEDSKRLYPAGEGLGHEAAPARAAVNSLMRISVSTFPSLTSAMACQPPLPASTPTVKVSSQKIGRRK